MQRKCKCVTVLATADLASLTAKSYKKMLSRLIVSQKMLNTFHKFSINKLYSNTISPVVKPGHRRENIL